MSKQAAAIIRKQLKALGITSRQVSVRYRSCTISGAVDVVIKDVTVPIARVREIAMAHKSVSRCSVSGEILGGGNTYVDVQVDRDVLEALAATVEPELPTDNTVREVRGLRVHAHPHEHFTYVVDHETWARPVHVFGREHCAQKVVQWGIEVRQAEKAVA